VVEAAPHQRIFAAQKGAAHAAADAVIEARGSGIDELAAGCGQGCSVTGREALGNQQIARRCVGKRLFDACPSPRSLAGSLLSTHCLRWSKLRPVSASSPQRKARRTQRLMQRLMQ